MSLEAIRREVRQDRTFAELLLLEFYQRREEARIERAMNAPQWHLA